MKHLDYFNAQAARESAQNITPATGGVGEAIGSVFEFVFSLLRIVVDVAQLFV